MLNKGSTARCNYLCFVCNQKLYFNNSHTKCIKIYGQLTRIILSRILVTYYSKPYYRILDNLPWDNLPWDAV